MFGLLRCVECLGLTRWVVVACALAVVMSPSPVLADTAANQQAALRAAVWLESVQNPDGSWGADPDVRVAYTSAVVDAFRDYSRTTPAYFRGVTWLENHFASNLDDHARRASALLPHGDDVTSDRASLSAGFRGVPGLGSGWGLSSVYGASPLDTALVLLAFADLGVGADASKVQAGIDFLKTSRTSDNGWSARGNTAGDPIITAYAVRAIKRHVNLDPTALTAIGNAAVLGLNVTAGSSATANQWAHAAFAVLSWTPGTTNADGYLTQLIGAQVASGTTAGSWEGSIYATAVGLRAFSLRLGTNDPNLQTIVQIPDFGLRSAVNFALQRNRGDAVRRGDLRSLTVLDASGQGITNLAGLAEFTSLTRLDLRHNAITDVSGLSSLPPGTTVLLQDNPWAGRLCDVNGDTLVDSGDVLLAMRVARGDLTPTLLQKTRADVGPSIGPGDGLVDSSDVLVMERGVTVPGPSPCNP